MIGWKKVIKNFFCERKQRLSVFNDLCRLFSLDLKDVKIIWTKFKRFYDRQKYAHILGESKTLNKLESFITYVLLAAQQPSSIIEIGTFYGKSTRRIIDMKASLGLSCPVTCYDISNDVKYFHPEEATLIVEDITPNPTKCLSQYASPSLIFLDARPYHLLKNVVTSCLNELPNVILTVHDCSPSLCHKDMKLDRSCTEITSATGTWERHVLAECFGVSDPLDDDLNDVTTQTHRLVIFNTKHGLAALIPNVLIGTLSDRILQNTK